MRKLSEVGFQQVVYSSRLCVVSFWGAVFMHLTACSYVHLAADDGVGIFKLIADPFVFSHLDCGDVVIYQQADLASVKDCVTARSVLISIRTGQGMS